MCLSKKLESLAGWADSGVVVSVWPWFDGSWGAGIVLTNRALAEEQGLLAAFLPEQKSPLWNYNFGFLGGVNEMGNSPEEAVDMLQETLHLMKQELSLKRQAGSMILRDFASYLKPTLTSTGPLGSRPR